MVAVKLMMLSPAVPEVGVMVSQSGMVLFSSSAQFALALTLMLVVPPSASMDTYDADTDSWLL